MTPLPGQLAFDLGEPFADEIVWGSKDLARLVAGAPAPDGHGAETLPEMYRTDRNGKS